MIVSRCGNASSGDETDRFVADGQATETGNEVGDVASHFDEEMNLIDELNALESQQQTNEKTEIDSGAGNGIENVKTALDVDCTQTDSLRTKGFAVNTSGRFRIVMSLPLMAVQSTLSLYEIRCDRFPIEMMENELMPIFERFGQVYKLCKNTVSNLIVVTYTSSTDAGTAIQSLDRSIIQGQMVRVNKHLANGRLIVKPIPRSATKRELCHKFRAGTNNLQSVSLFNDPHNENKNRGFCYLDYGSHERAIAAKKILSSKRLFGTKLTVEWPNRRFDWVETRDTLYISNLRSSVRCEHLKSLFSGYGELLDVQQFGNFGKVQFKNDDDAVRAAGEIDKSRLGNANVEVSFVKLSEKIELPKKAPPKTERPNNDPDASDTLYISNVSPNLSTADLLKIFRYYGDVVGISAKDNFVSVQFRQSEESKRAVRCINRNQLGIDVQISCTEPNINKKPTKSSDTLFVNSLRSDISASDLRKCFSVFGEVTEIDKTNDSASVRFKDSENAKRAACDIDKTRLGNNVEISLSRKPKKLPGASDTLYINNLHADIKASRLRELFSVYGEVVAVDKNDNAAAVKFCNFQSSARAAREVNRKSLGEANVEISFSPMK